MNQPDSIPFEPTDTERLTSIERRLELGSARMNLLEMGLANNTKVTLETSAKVDGVLVVVSQVRDIFTTSITNIKVLKLMGAIAAACSAVYVAFYMATHGGNPPG